MDLLGSHETAALVHGLPLLSAYEGPPVLTRDRAPREDRPGHASPAPLVSQVPASHRASVSGAVVTSMPRTAVDLARKGPALSAVVVLDAALRAGVSRQELEAILDDCRGWPGSVAAREHVAFADGRAGVSRQELEARLDDCRGWPGSVAAREHVAFADGRAETPLESVGRWRLHQAELPAPELQVVLRDAYGFIGRVDFHWKAFRTVGEADGFGKYRTADGAADFAALREEKVREDRLRDSGEEVFRFTWEEAVHRPVVLEQRARRAFARAQARRAG